MNKLFSAIVSASLVFGSAAVAHAQQAPAAPAAGTPWMGQNLTPAQSSGAVTRYILGPSGGVRGFQLQNGAVVMVRPHEGATIAQRVPVGQSVRVEGMVAQGATPMMFHRATVRAADGTVIVEPRAMGEGHGPGGRHGGRPDGDADGHEGGRLGGHPGGRGMGHGGGRHGGAMGGHDRFARMGDLPAHSVNGTVQTVLTGPGGHAHMLLLSNNTTVLVTRPMAMAMGARQVRVGESVRANGRGGSFAQGSSVIAESLTFGDGTTVNAPLRAEPSAPPAR